VDACRASPPAGIRVELAGEVTTMEFFHGNGSLQDEGKSQREGNLKRLIDCIRCCSRRSLRRSSKQVTLEVSSIFRHLAFRWFRSFRRRVILRRLQESSQGVSSVVAGAEPATPIEVAMHRRCESTHSASPRIVAA